MPQPARNGFEPFVVLPAWCMFSATFLYTTYPEYGEKAQHVMSRVWTDSSPAAMEEAKQLSNQVLDTVLRSQLSTFFLGTLMVSVYALVTLVTKVVFLGRLTVIETQRLNERLMMFVLLKVVFFGAVVNPTYKEVGTWATWFFAMGYLKMFVGLAGDRCEALLSSPSSTTFQHLRCMALLGGILAHVCGWMADYVSVLQGEQARLSSAVLWLFDGATIIVEATHGIIKYGVHALERWRSLQAEKRGEMGCGPWEWQGTFLYHLELGTDLLLHSLTLGHYLHLWLLHGLRFQLIDMVLFLDVRYMAVVIWRRLRGYRRYRRLTALVQHSFPDAAAEQLEGAECAICMERMAAAKVLPCRHVFHVPCLRAWLQQSRAGVFSCPMCRASLLGDDGMGTGGRGWAAAHAGWGSHLQGNGHPVHALREASATEEAAAADEGQAGEQEPEREVEPVGAMLVALATTLAAASNTAVAAHAPLGNGSGAGGGLDGEDERALAAGLWAAAQLRQQLPEEQGRAGAGEESLSGQPGTQQRPAGSSPLADSMAAFERLWNSGPAGDDSPAGCSAGRAAALSSHHHRGSPPLDQCRRDPSVAPGAGACAAASTASLGGVAGRGDTTAADEAAVEGAEQPAEQVTVAAMTASIAARSLMTASRAMSQLTRSVGRQGYSMDVDEPGEDGEVVDQPPPTTSQVRSGARASRHHYQLRARPK